MVDQLPLRGLACRRDVQTGQGMVEEAGDALRLPGPRDPLVVTWALNQGMQTPTTVTGPQAVSVSARTNRPPGIPLGTT